VFLFGSGLNPTWVLGHRKMNQVWALDRIHEAPEDYPVIVGFGGTGPEHHRPGRVLMNRDPG